MSETMQFKSQRLGRYELTSEAGTRWAHSGIRHHHVLLSRADYSDDWERVLRSHWRERSFRSIQLGNT